MSKARLLFVTCFVVFAASALVSATASAAVSGWEVNGTLLAGTAAIASKAPVLHSGRLVAAGVELECTGSTVDIVGGFIRHPDEVLANGLVFHGCEVTNEAATNCKLKATTLISTLPLFGLAELDGASSLNTLILASPLPSKTFAVIPFEGEKCALAGNQPVTQSKFPAVSLLIHEGGVSAVLHLVLAFSNAASLKLGNSEATLSGADADVQLASGLPVAFL